MFKITKAEAIKYHEIFKAMVQALSDEDALQVPKLYQNWEPDTEYVVDERVLYNDVLYKCLIAHTSQETWTPDVSPSLFARVLIPDPHVELVPTAFTFAEFAAALRHVYEYALRPKGIAT